MFELTDELHNIDSLEIENQLIETFGDVFIIDAIRILGGNIDIPGDAAVIHEALSIVVAMYVRKIKAGEINKNKVYH
jgi:hypothetical protein